MKNKKLDYTVIGSIFILTVARFIFISTTSIIDDEAYYYFFSKHLSGGYIDHGPVIAIIIKFSTILFGENGFGVRALGIILFTLLGIELYYFGKRYFNHLTGIVLSATLLINILFHASSIIMTPDSPLLIFCILTIIFYYKAYFVHKNYFYAAGVFLGLGLLSKISVVFPAFGIFLFPFLLKDKQYLLKESRFYLSYIIALIIFLPFIIWNYNNDWVFIRYQGSHIMQVGDIQDFMGLWGALALLVGPTFFYFIIILPIKTIYQQYRNSDSMNSARFYFTLTVAIPLLYFFIHSTFLKLEVNWPAPIFFGGLFIFAIEIGNNWNKRRNLFIFQLVYSFVLISLITIQNYYKILPISSKSDPTSRYYHYSCFTDDIGEFLKNASLKNYRLLSNNYQIPSMINFLIKPQIESTCLSIGYHNTYYSFLYPDDSLIGFDYIYISKGRKFPISLEKYFTNITFLKTFKSARNNTIVKEYSLWLVKNYKGKLFTQ